MSSIQSVQGGTSAPAAALDAKKLAAPKAQAAKTETTAQEAQETAAVTKAEAAQGDQQAIRKLAQAQATSKLQKPEPAAAAPTQGGGNVNIVA